MSGKTDFKDISPIPSLLLGGAVATHTLYINDRNEVNVNNNDKHIITLIYSYYLAYTIYLLYIFIYDNIGPKEINIFVAGLVIIPLIFIFIKTKMKIYTNWFNGINKISRHNIVYSYMLIQLVFTFVYLTCIFKKATLSDSDNDLDYYYNKILFYVSIMYIIFYFFINKISVPSPNINWPFTTINWYILNAPFPLETNYNQTEPSDKWIYTNVNIYKINDTEYSYMKFFENEKFMDIDIDDATIRFKVPDDDGDDESTENPYTYINLESNNTVPEYIKSLVNINNENENIVFFKTNNDNQVIKEGNNINISYTNKEVSEAEKKYNTGDFIKINGIVLSEHKGKDSKFTYNIEGDPKLLYKGDSVKFEDTNGKISINTYTIKDIKQYTIDNNLKYKVIFDKDINEKDFDKPVYVYSKNISNRTYKLPSNDGLVNFIKIIEQLNILFTFYIFSTKILNEWYAPPMK